MIEIGKIVPPQKILGKHLKAGDVCIRFPMPTELSSSLLRVVGGRCPRGHAKAIDLFTGKAVHIEMETHMLKIKV